jgi:hypothetical protein
MRKFYTLITVFILSLPVLAQNEKQDTMEVKTPSQDAAYTRPFILDINNLSTAVGGYFEGNSNYFSEDGVSEGLSFELRRFNIFLYSSIGPAIRFLSELEFEHGTEEIALETAQIDFQFFPEFVLRGGIILVPIGSFNQNHDSPRWDIIDRPLVSTQIIPATLSEVGFGGHGRLLLSKNLSFTYAGYLTNGLSDGVILNSEGRTFIPDGKGEEAFKEDNNGLPAYSGRIAVQHSIGELGFSFYHCVYNSFRIEGTEVDEKRNLSIAALDYSVKFFEVSLQGEAAYGMVEVPDNISEIYGDKQWGAFIDVIYPVYQGSLFLFSDAVINSVVRFEYIDFNMGNFGVTSQNIRDEITALVLGLSFRPVSNTVIKANYRRHWTIDPIGNPTIHTAGFQFGFASYF